MCCNIVRPRTQQASSASQEELSTPLFLKEAQHTDVIPKLHLALAASLCLKRCGDPEVTGDVCSLPLPKAGKGKWHVKRHTLGRQNHRPLVCKEGASSPSLLVRARSQKPCVIPLPNSAQKGEQTLESAHP